MTCCGYRPEAYGKFFSRRVARRDARRYRRRGLDGTAKAMVEFLGLQRLRGASVLEVGGGVGAIELELLKRGAAHATNVELSPEYDEEALRLADEAGLSDRLDRRVGDFVAEQAALKPADVVVMHRVVCCYPDPDALLGAAAAKTLSALVFSFPRETWWIRLAFTVINGAMRLRRCAFRSYVHPVAQLLEIPRERGLELDFEQTGLIWRVAGFRQAS